MTTFYILVAGSRNYNDFNEFSKVMDCVLSYHVKEHHPIVIVSGGAKGADFLAERYADMRGYAKHIIPAEWKMYNKRAGYIRNNQMHDYIRQQKDMPRGCICFWSTVEKSAGTRQNFSLCKKFDTPLKVFDYATHRFLREDEISHYL